MKQLSILCCLFVMTSFTSTIKSYTEDNLIKNTIEQLDFLVEKNKTTKQQWYIYIAGGTLNDLKYIIDKTKREKLRYDYLKTLNDSLISLNAKDQVAVYVAFTDYENKILTPIFPEDAKTLSQKESYIKSLIINNDPNHSPKELLKSLEELKGFSEDFQKQIELVYQGSELSKSDKPTILMPFSSYSIRDVIQQNTTTYKEKKYFSSTLYVPKHEKRINKDKLKQIYNSFHATYGISESEQKIDKLVEAIRIYFYDDTFAYVPCKDLLKKYRNKSILQDFPDFRKLAEENPCILENVVGWGEDIEKSEWMTMTETLIAIPLYAALAIPASAVLGAEAARQLGKKKIKDAAISAATNIAVQTVFNYYFGSESIINEKDTQKRWKKALYALDKYEFSKEVAESVFDLSTRQKIALACLDGMKIENFDWDNMDPTSAKIQFEIGDCMSSVMEYIFIEKITDQALGYLVEKLKKLATTNPKLFVKAWRELSKDLDIKSDFKKGMKQYREDMLEAIGITTMQKKVSNYILSSFEVEDAFDGAIKEYASEIGQSASLQFENTIKDAAIETEIKIRDKVGDMFSDGIHRKIVGQGANVSLDFVIAGKNVKIYATLLEKLDDGTYKVVFVNTPQNSTSNIAQFIANTTINRKTILNALQKRDIDFTATGKGANARKLDIDGKTINIAEIELRTQKADGTFERKQVVGSRVANAVGKLVNKLDNSLFSVLKGKINQLDDVLKPQFLDDFADASDDILKKLQDENLFDAWKNNVRSTDLEVLRNSVANSNLRGEYDGLVSALSGEKIKLLNEGKTMEEVARALQAERRRLTIHYKHITPDDFLEWIFKRNDITYTKTGRGDKWGATFDGLFTSIAKKKGIDLKNATQSQLDEVYESIANGASRTSGATKKQLGDNFYDFFENKISKTELDDFERLLKKYRMR